MVATLAQAITASKAAFARTPKVRDRTVTPPLFLFSPFVLAGLAAMTFLYAYQHRHRENMAYAALNVVLTLYAIAAFIGLGNCVVDAWVHLRALLSKPAEPRSRRFHRSRRSETTVPVEAIDWRSVLQLGDDGDPPAWPSSPTELLRVAATNSIGGLPEPGDFRTVFQPIVDLAAGDPVGYEALTRFNDGSSPERLIADAVAAGAGLAMEGMLARAALQAAHQLPGTAWLAVKGSPRLIEADRSLVDLIRSAGRRVVVEVTEPSTSDVPPELRRLRRLLPDNAEVAIEHARLGHKTLAVLVELRPRYVKLDRAATHGIAGDRARQAQLATLVQLAAESECEVVATGVESEDDRAVLREVGVALGQGFIFGRPAELVDA